MNETLLRRSAKRGKSFKLFREVHAKGKMVDKRTQGNIPAMHKGEPNPDTGAKPP